MNRPGHPDQNRNSNPVEPGANGNPPQHPGDGQPHEGQPDSYGVPDYGGRPYGGEQDPYGDPNYGGEPYGQLGPYGEPNYGGQPYGDPNYGGQPSPFGEPNYGGQPYGDLNYGGQPGPYSGPNYGGPAYGDLNYGVHPFGPPHGGPNYGGQPDPYGAPNYDAPYGAPIYDAPFGDPYYGAPHGGGPGPMVPDDGEAQPEWRLGPGGWEPAADGGNQTGPGNADDAPQDFDSGEGDVGKQGGEGDEPDAGNKSGGEGDEPDDGEKTGGEGIEPDAREKTDGEGDEPDAGDMADGEGDEAGAGEKSGGEGNGKLVAIIAAVVLLVVAGGAWALMPKGATEEMSGEMSGETPEDIDALPMSGGTITTATYTQCAVSEGDVRCWGLAFEGLINDHEDLDNISYPVKINGLPKVESVWAGEKTICAIDAEGAPYCWGNLDESMGMFRAGVTSVPVKIEGIRAREVRPGKYSTCAVDVDNAVWCWGSNRNGTLGIEENIKTAEPRRVPGLPEIRTLTRMPRDTVFALDVDGNVWGWGGSQYGYIPGVGGGDVRVTSPVKIEGIPAMKTIAAGGGFEAACGVTEEAGEVWCWGNNYHGRMGQPRDAEDNSPEAVPVPVKIEGVSDVVAIDVDIAVVAVLADGTAVYWGLKPTPVPDTGGELHVPRPLEGPGNFNRVSVGNYHVALVDEEGKIYGIGNAVFGFQSDGERLEKFSGITVDS